MFAKENFEKLNNSKAVGIIKRLLSSKFFPFFTALIVVGCYYLSWDMVTIWYMGLCGMAMLLLLKDITPIISLFLFMNIMISWKNSPSVTAGNSDFYFQPAVLVQIGIIIAVYVLIAVFRVSRCVKEGNFKPTPTFWGLYAFAFAMLVNGAFAEEYTAMNLVYGLFMAFFFLFIFVLGSANIKVNEQNFEKIAWGFIALSLCLIIELIVTFATCDGVLDDGQINRGVLSFGWGIYNTMGMLFTISLPSVAYLAIKYRHGWIFTAYLIILILFTYLTLSRQAMLCGTAVFCLCLVAIFCKVKNKMAHGCVLIVGTALVATLYFIFSDVIYTTLSKLFDDFFNGSGRIDIWKSGYDNFLKNPVFGVGFFAPMEGDPGFTGLEIIPRMYHNTLVQVLATGGAIAIIAYLLHRVQTIISYIKNPTFDRTYIALTVAALLIVSLLDNHMFYILPTLVYSMLVAVLINSEKTDERTKLK